MPTARLVVFTALLLVVAAPSFAGPCGYNPVIVGPDTVESLSTGNQATFTADTNPAFIDWTITNGTITLESSTVNFTAGRHGSIQLHLVVGNGQNCADEAFKTIQIVHPCTVTPLSRVVSETYVGGTTTLDVQANCEWDVIVPAVLSWVRVVGPSTFTGNGTVTFEFDPLPFDNSSQSTGGRGATIYVGDKDVPIRQAGGKASGPTSFATAMPICSGETSATASPGCSR